MLRFVNVATPPDAATDDEPESTPLDGLVAIVIVTVPPNDATALPKASCAETRIAGAIAAPAVALDGCTVKLSVAAAPALTVNGVLVVPVRAPDEADSV